MDGSIRTKASLRGQLLLQLRPGTHTARLQWLVHYDDKGVSWMDLNSIEGGFLGGEKLLAIVNMQKNAPRLVMPKGRNLTLQGREDVPLQLAELFYVDDIEEEVADHYTVAVMLQAGNGLVSLASTDRLNFINGDGVEDQFMYFTGRHARREGGRGRQAGGRGAERPPPPAGRRARH